ncbi:MAG: extracellular solute-binding protein [Firmicutes bacterium]|nr:extracellular solute-binding protein [Bacillota bacterium]
MKKTKMRKVLTVVICLMIVFSGLSGCAGSGGNKTENTQTTQTKEPITLKIFGVDDVAKASYVLKTLEEKFNVKFENREIDGTKYKEQYQMMIASGDIPDIFTWIDIPTYTKYATQGILAELPIATIEKYAPRIDAWLKKSFNGDPYAPFIRNGKNYALPNYSLMAEHFNAFGIRHDWLEKVGIGKTPETLDELEIALNKFTNEDPDGNGKKDTFGWSTDGSGIPTLFYPVFGAYGVYPGMFTEKNGKIVRGEIQPGAKQALTLLNKWFKAGYLDPEFFVNKWDNVMEKWLAEKFGVVTWAWWELSPKDAFWNGRLRENLLEKNPTSNLVVIPFPKGPDGESGSYQNYPLSSFIAFGKPLEKDQEKLQKYLEVMDESSMNPKQKEFVYYGVEGKTFKKNADGDYEFIPPYNDEAKRKEFGIGLDPGVNHQDYNLQFQFMTKKKYLPYVSDVMKIAVGKYDILAGIDKPIYNEKYDSLNQFTYKSFVKFITGEKSLDEFDNFISEWEKMGGDKIMEEAQQKYDEYLKK